MLENCYNGKRFYQSRMKKLLKAFESSHRFSRDGMKSSTLMQIGIKWNYDERDKVIRNTTHLIIQATTMDHSTHHILTFQLFSIVHTARMSAV